MDPNSAGGHGPWRARARNVSTRAGIGSPGVWGAKERTYRSESWCCSHYRIVANQPFQDPSSSCCRTASAKTTLPLSEVALYRRLRTTMSVL